MVEPTVDSYNDGSSTESEYYYDLIEDMGEKEASLTFAQEYNVSIKQEPQNEPEPHQREEESSFERTESKVEEWGKYALPQGSEWSHGVVLKVSDNAVERALAMARDLERATRGDEVVTFDTTNSNASLSIEEKKKKQQQQLQQKMMLMKNMKKTVVAKKRERVMIKTEVESLKRVKTTISPVSVTQPMDVGLRQQVTNVLVEESSEVDTTPAVTGSSWKVSESYSSPKIKEIEKGALPCQSQSRDEAVEAKMVVPSSSTEHNNSVASQRITPSMLPSTGQNDRSKSSIGRPEERESHTERNSSPSSRQTYHRNSPTRRRAEKEVCTERDTSQSIRQTNYRNSPARCSAEKESHRKRDTSPVAYRLKRSSVNNYSRRDPVIYYSRRSRSRSPLSRRVNKRRPRSRSSCRASTTSPRSRSHRLGKSVPSRQHHDSKTEKRRLSHTCERSRSPLRFSQSVQGKRKSRERHARHESRPRYIYYENHEVKSVQEPSGNKHVDRQSPSHHTRISWGDQGSNRDTFQHRSVDYHCSRSVHARENLSMSQRDDYKFENRNNEKAEMPIAARASYDLNKSKSIGRAYCRDNAVDSTTRSLTKPYVRSRGNARAASYNDGKKYVTPRDDFERQVFKLKLREADVDDMMASGSNNWLLESRKRGCVEERAQLMAQDLERFENVYASLSITPHALKRYQSDRDFSWRVVQFKRKQESLQEQNDLFMSIETKTNVWRVLDKEREELIAENTVLFRKVMMSKVRPAKRRDSNAFTASGSIAASSGKRGFELMPVKRAVHGKT
ncbi:unnamed protein product [Peronospora belbahrii]|uniref:Uncharacterized protein n=1 Tax=Peronospora belbahrii TaxID=622444 RepID=A0AAU9KMS4_9STRA|nr:unnamed protein product [Peronospora belbahrii]